MKSAACTVFLAVGVLSGCIAPDAVTDTRNLVVTPGRGLPGFCEVGMSLSEVESATHDVHTHGVNDDWRPWGRWKTGRFGLIPSLGVVIFLERSQPLKHFEFHVQAYKSQTIPAINITRPFKGRIESGPSFSQASVTKKEVESFFGELPVDTNATAYVTHAESHRPFCWKRADGVEELWYFDRGITFIVQSNAVTSFRIYSPQVATSILPNPPKVQ